MSPDSAVAPARSPIVLRRTRPLVSKHHDDRPAWMKQPSANNMAKLLRTARQDIVNHGWGELARHAGLMGVGEFTDILWTDVQGWVYEWVRRATALPDKPDGMDIEKWLMVTHPDTYAELWGTYGHTWPRLYTGKWIDHMVEYLESVQ